MPAGDDAERSDEEERRTVTAATEELTFESTSRFVDR
jgi:hypothetical protein